MSAPSAITGGAKMTGLEAYDQAMRGLGFSAARQIVARSLRAGAKMVQQNQQSLAPERTGATRKAIKVRAGKNTRDGKVRIVSTIGKATFVGDQFYGAFQEFGWKTGKRGQSGKVKLKNGKFRTVATGSDRRQIPGEHFLKYGFDEAKDAAIAAISDTYKTLINQVVAGRAAAGGDDA